MGRYCYCYCYPAGRWAAAFSQAAHLHADPHRAPFRTHTQCPLWQPRRQLHPSSFDRAGVMRWAFWGSSSSSSSALSLLHPSHVQLGMHRNFREKHSQYFLRQRVREHEQYPRHRVRAFRLAGRGGVVSEARHCDADVV